MTTWYIIKHFERLAIDRFQPRQRRIKVHINASIHTLGDIVNRRFTVRKSLAIITKVNHSSHIGGQFP